MNNLRAEQCAEADLEKVVFLGEGASLTINGGSFIGSKETGVDALFYDNAAADAVLTINDGHFEANCGLAINHTPGNGAGILSISKATFLGADTALWNGEEGGGITTQEAAERLLAGSSEGVLAGIFDKAYIEIDKAQPVLRAAAASSGTQLSGEGTENNPYIIGTTEQLLAFAALVQSGNSAAHAALSADLDLSGKSWTGISANEFYTGVFDGKGYAISNLTGTEGLFVKNAGTIKNVRLENVNITKDGGNIGAAAGVNTGTVFNCSSSGSLSGTGGGAYSIGGLVGHNNGGVLSGSASSCTVGGMTAGGLTGSNYCDGEKGKIIACIYTGNAVNPVEGDGTYSVCTDVYYRVENNEWRSYHGNETQEEQQLLEKVNRYIRENDGAFILNGDGTADSGNAVCYLDIVEGEPVTKYIETYQILTKEILSASGNTLSSGWYVVDGTLSLDSRMVVNGDVKLILKDSSNLTVNGGIDVSGSNSLTVYAQSDGEAMGILTTQNPKNGYAGIGGRDDTPAGTITINGGVVDVNGTYSGTYGIGAGRGQASGTITINNGRISVDRGGYYSYYGGHIGGGIGASSGTCNVIITGGTIEILGGLMAHGNGIGGKLITGEHGSAVLYANWGVYMGSSITDVSERANWNLLLYEWGQATAYGKVTLQESIGGEKFEKLVVDGSLTIPNGVELVIGENSELVNKGTITVQDGGILTIRGTVSEEGSLVVQNGGIVNKGARSAPAAPGVQEQEAESITVSSKSGQRYACTTENLAPDVSSDSWKTATGDTLTFGELAPGTVYYLYTYIPSSDYYQTSPVSAATEATTLPKLVLSADTTSYVQTGRVSVTMESTEPAEAYVRRSGDMQWEKLSLQDGTGTFETAQNGFYYFAAVLSGNEVEQAEYQMIHFSRIDNTKPKLSIDSGDYVPGTWSSQEIVLSAANTADNLGSTAFLYRVDEGEWQSYTDELTVSDETAGTTYTFKAISASGVESDPESITVKLDKTAPDGDIVIEENSVKKLINQITFGLFFNRNIDVTITGSDTLSGMASLEYYRSEELLSEEAVKAVTDWKKYESLSETAENAEKFVYYVRLTDKAGNVTCFGSEGVTFDLEEPEITGIVNGATYYTTQKATVTDANLKEVTLDGEPVGTDEAITLTGNVAKTYTIAASDKAGNRKEYKVTMQPIEKLAEDIADLSVENVSSDDAAQIEAVKGAVEAIDDQYADEAEKAALQGIIDKCDLLSDKLEETAGALNSLGEDVATYTGEAVTLSDKAAVIQLQKEIQDLLDGGNLTEEERADLEKKLKQIDETVASLEKTEDVCDMITALPKTAAPDDLAAEAAVKAAKEQYDKLTKHEQSLVPKELREKLEGLLGELQDYRIIEGSGSQWKIGGSGTLTIIANGPVEKFTGIKVDGKAVDAANYIVSSGSTVITLKQAYLNTLSAGKHTLTVLYTDGETSGEFEIVKNAKITTASRTISKNATLRKTGSAAPKTGDNSRPALLIGLMLAAVCSLVGLMVYSRNKKKHRKQS